MKDERFEEIAKRLDKFSSDMNGKSSKLLLSLAKYRATLPDSTVDAWEMFAKFAISAGDVGAIVAEQIRAINNEPATVSNQDPAA